MPKFDAKEEDAVASSVAFPLPLRLIKLALSSSSAIFFGFARLNERI
jgi:hypothetical protein